LSIAFGNSVLHKPERSLYQLDEERVVPWGDPALFAWHRARYEFAVPFVSSRRVLDVGCGEGYGAALLSRHADDVLAIDYSPAAIEHARKTYPSLNLRFAVADATRLDPAIGKFNVITCFEVIEHIEDTHRFFAQIAQALHPNGWLLLSTPNAMVDRLFDVIRDVHYEYHVNVLTPTELRGRVKRYFHHATLYGQCLRGNRLHLVLKRLDALNLRHRLIRSERVQRDIGRALMGLPSLTNSSSLRDFWFSRMLVRQSPVTVLTARAPKPTA
jgi:2-polyprenyl-3-methyl-5-hydroxy-6-metoxy-1,4-benzoquinol methylase